MLSATANQQPFSENSSCRLVTLESKFIPNYFPELHRTVRHHAHHFALYMTIINWKLDPDSCGIRSTPWRGFSRCNTRWTWKAPPKARRYQEPSDLRTGHGLPEVSVFLRRSVVCISVLESVTFAVGLPSLVKLQQLYFKPLLTICLMGRYYVSTSSLISFLSLSSLKPTYPL